MGVKLNHNILSRIAYSQFVESHIPHRIAGVVEGVNRHSCILALLVGGPSVGPQFLDEVCAILGDLQLEPLEDVNAVPDRIGTLLGWLDVKAKSIDFFDALRFR